MTPDADLSVVDAEARAWVRRLASGIATRGDARRLKEWCAASESHAQAFERARRTWREVGEVGKAYLAAHRHDAGALSAANAANAGTRPFVPVRRERRMFLAGGLSAAGALALTGAIWPPLRLWPSLTELNADYRTAIGEQRHLQLGDHVHVAMNTQTSLSADMGGSVDRIELLAGEAAVTRQRAGKPLEIHAAAGRVFVGVGELQVRRFPDRVCVTCTGGRIEIQHPAGGLALGENQQAFYDDVALQAPRPVDSAEISAWRDGVVVFRDTPLEDAVAEINRYRPGRVVVFGERLASRRLSGRFEVASLDVAITQIERLFGAEARHFAGGIVLLT